MPKLDSLAAQEPKRRHENDCGNSRNEVSDFLPFVAAFTAAAIVRCCNSGPSVLIGHQSDLQFFDVHGANAGEVGRSIKIRGKQAKPNPPKIRISVGQNVTFSQGTPHFVLLLHGRRNGWGGGIMLSGQGADSLRHRNIRAALSPQESRRIFGRLAGGTEFAIERRPVPTDWDRRACPIKKTSQSIEQWKLDVNPRKDSGGACGRHDIQKPGTPQGLSWYRRGIRR